MKTDCINKSEIPFQDEGLAYYMQNTNLTLYGVYDKADAYQRCDILMIALPTDLTETGELDTRSIEFVIKEGLGINPNIITIIKSTVPIGFTERMKQIHHTERIYFMPEFLREGHMYSDVFSPDRLICGGNNVDFILSWYMDSYEQPSNINIIRMSSTEAECVKLFANTYLAMRIAFFNELDSLAEKNGLDTAAIIRGLCADSRIGSYYNNPSFGFGGYCLPKDASQLSAYAGKDGYPLLHAVSFSNEFRKQYIINLLLKRYAEVRVFGIYKVSMKLGSDNSKNSSVLDIIKGLLDKNRQILVYSPQIDIRFLPYEAIVENDFSKFVHRSELILANRIENELLPYIHKVYTRDQFRRD